MVWPAPCSGCALEADGDVRSRYMAAPDRTRLTGPPRISLDGGAPAHARARALFFAGVARFSRQERSDEGMGVVGLATPRKTAAKRARTLPPGPR